MGAYRDVCKSATGPPARARPAAPGRSIPPIREQRTPGASEGCRSRRRAGAGAWPRSPERSYRMGFLAVGAVPLAAGAVPLAAGAVPLAAGAVPLAAGADTFLYSGCFAWARVEWHVTQTFC